MDAKLSIVLLCVLLAVPGVLPRRRKSAKGNTGRNRDQGYFGRRDRADDFRPDKYYRYNDMMNYLHALESEHGDMVRMELVGSSHKRKDIPMITITESSGSTGFGRSRGKRASKPGVFIEAGIHGREWAAPAAALALIDDLVQGKTSDGKDLLSEADVHIMPIVNPDGYEYTWTKDRMWNYNRARRVCDGGCCGEGVNVNHNFPMPYRERNRAASERACDRDNYKGKRELSEPEAKAISDGIKSAGNVELFVSLHTFGQQIFVPYGKGLRGGDKPDNFDELMDVAHEGADAMYKATRKRYDVIHSADKYPASGSTEDWARGVLDIPFAFLVQLRPTPSTRESDFDLPGRQLKDVEKELVAGVNAMAKAALGGGGFGRSPTGFGRSRG